MDPKLRLHRARVERGIDLNRITAVTALSPMVVRKIDEGRFEDLPGGVYARSYIRAFAEAVGLRGDEALHEVEALLPGAPDPLPTLREKSHPSWLDGIRATVAARLHHLPKPGSLPALLPARPRLPDISLDLAARLEPLTRLSMLRQRSRSAPSLTALGRRASAALVDAVLLLIMGAGLIGLTALVAGVTVAALLEDAGAALAAAYSIPIALYFLLFEGIAGQTPGGALCGYRKGTRPAAGSATSLLSPAARRRAPHYAAEERVGDDSLEVCFESETSGFEGAATATDR